MSVAFNDKSIPVLQQEYATKAELHYGLRIAYGRIAIIINEHNIPAHLIDGKIKFKVKENLLTDAPENTYSHGSICLRRRAMNVYVPIKPYSKDDVYPCEIDDDLINTMNKKFALVMWA